MSSVMAEFVGTLALVFFGAGAAAVGTGGIIGVALVHALVLMLNLSLLKDYGPSHFNPALTLAIWIRGQGSFQSALTHIGAQLAASLVAGACLFFFIGDLTTDVGATHFGAMVFPFTAFLLEMIMTFIFIVVIFNSNRQSHMAYWQIPAALGVLILFAGPITGASLNPARSLGPNLFSGASEELWIYLCAPLLGGALAGWWDAKGSKYPLFTY